MAILFCGSLISNAFGSLFASAILDVMDGILGYAAWRLVSLILTDPDASRRITGGCSLWKAP
jgi:hypothetical protein